MQNVHISMNILKKENYSPSQGKTIQQSAVAKLAYNHGADYGPYHYSAKQKDDFIKSYILKPDNKPFSYANAQEMAQDLEDLDKNRTQSQYGYNLIISLDHSLNLETNEKILNELINEQFTKYGLVSDIAIHNKNNSNLHAHVFVPMREIDNDGKFKKSKFQGGFKNKDFNSNFLRERWAKKINAERKKLGILEEVSTKSNSEKIQEFLDKDDVVSAAKLDYEVEKKQRRKRRRRGSNQIEMKKRSAKKEQAEK
uniref:MobA/MobL family protein n=1 Tax=Lonepinella sp. BR2357 TaxID=3434549 RepID=UPI003F6DF8F7